MEVCDLFYNTPARRKFLRSDRTEMRHLEESIKAIALGRFDVSVGWRPDTRPITAMRPARTEGEKAKRVAKCFGGDFIREVARYGVEFASLENMRRMEQEKSFWLGGGRMKPADRSNPQSFKVRRAKVGGYRDYFDDEQAAAIDALMAARQGPLFGYLDASEAPPVTAGDCSEDGGDG